MNGKGIPTTGIIPSVIPILIKKYKTKMEVNPIARSFPKLFFAITEV